MRRNATGIAAGVVIAGLTGCAGSPSAAPGTSSARYTFSCCALSDLQQNWRPGTTVTLHWMAQAAGGSTDPAAHAVTLTARLSGPYADVASLKKAGVTAVPVVATATTTTDRTAASPTTTLTLPSGLVAGYYDLVTVVASTVGRSSGATVIQLLPAQ